MQLKLFLLTTLFLLLVSESVFAHNKVVVIPLSEEASSSKNLLSVDGEWDCDLGETCQDVYEFSVGESASAILDIDAVTGNSVLRLALYGPGQNLGGTNLLTGNINDLECPSGQNAPFNASVNLPSAGTYKLAIGRDWGSSAGFSGSYSTRFYTSAPRIDIRRTVDDGTSQASDSSSGAPCASSISVSETWQCQLGETCQDVYEFTTYESGSAIIDISGVSGNSVLRLALYRPGQDLGGFNLLTGNNNDLECPGQDTTFNATIDLDRAGTYKLAIGRDWGSSAGFNGSYTSRFYTSIPRVDLGQTVSDGVSQAPGSVAGGLCPP